MSDPDRLAAIKVDLAPEELDWIEQHYKGIKDQVLWLIGQVDQLRDLLARLEWAGWHVHEDGADPACPVCDGLQDGFGGPRHAPDCWLAAALHTGNDEGAPPPK